MAFDSRLTITERRSVGSPWTSGNGPICQSMARPRDSGASSRRLSSTNCRRLHMRFVERRPADPGEFEQIVNKVLHAPAGVNNHPV